MKDGFGVSGGQGSPGGYVAPCDFLQDVVATRKWKHGNETEPDGSSAGLVVWTRDRRTWSSCSSPGHVTVSSSEGLMGVLNNQRNQLKVFVSNGDI